MEKSKKKIVLVKQEYQTHPWSKDIGGSVVLVEKSDRILRYENVKNVDAYVNSILKYKDAEKDVLSISVLGDDGTEQLIWQRK
jgi:hypothetical protein